MGNHAELERRNSTTQTIEPSIPKAAQRDRQPPPEHVDKLTTQSGIGVVSAASFGDRVVGSTSFVDVSVANLDAHADAWVRVTVDSPEFVVAAFPQRVLPSREGYHPADVVRLAFKPTREGTFHSTVTIEMGWPNTDRSMQTRSVTIVGQAHSDGTPTWSERGAAAADAHAKAAAVAADREQGQLVAAAHEQELDDHTPHPSLTTGAANGYHDALGALKSALTLVFAERRRGVSEAKDRALGYQRAPRDDHPVLRELAKLAVETVGTAIAVAASAEAEAAILAAFAVESVSKAAGAVVKEGVKKLGALAANAFDAPKAGEVNDGPARSFFGGQLGMLNLSERQASQTTSDMDAVMFPLVVKDPKLAAEAVYALVTTVDATAARASAAQSVASSRHWVDYVARASLGTSRIDPEVADLVSANQVPGRDGPKAHFDGIVDVIFEANITRDSMDVAFVSATLTGVKKETVQLIAETSLLEQRIPIRATAAPNAVSARGGITIVRDEKGRIAYSEEVEGRHLLERKGGGDASSGAALVLQGLVGARLDDKLKSDDVVKVNSDAVGKVK